MKRTRVILSDEAREVYEYLNIESGRAKVLETLPKSAGLFITL